MSSVRRIHGPGFVNRMMGWFLALECKEEREKKTVVVFQEISYILLKPETDFPVIARAQLEIQRA